MGIVRGQESHVGLLIEPELVYGVEAGGTKFRVPLISASDSTASSTTPPPAEIGTGIGGNPGSEPNTRTASGEFTTKLDYKAEYFGILMSASMGCVHSGPVNYDGFGVNDSGARTQTFFPQSFLDSVGPVSLTITAVKSGDAEGYMKETYVGAVITGWTIEQPDLEVPRITWRWISLPGEEGTWSGSLPAVGARNAVGINHGFTVQNEKVTTTGLQSMTVRSLSLEYNRNLSFATGFLNKVGLGAASGELESPGNEEPYDIRINLEYPVEDAISAGLEADYPYNYFLNGTSGKQFRFYWQGSTPYAASLLPQFIVSLPSVVWIEGEAPIVEGVLHARMVGRAQMDSSYNDTDQMTYAFTGQTYDFKSPIFVSMTEQYTAYRDGNGWFGAGWYLKAVEGCRPPGPSIFDEVDAALPNSYTYQVTTHFLQADATESAPTQLAPPDSDASIADASDLRVRFLLKAYNTINLPRYRLYASKNEGTFAAVPTAEVTVNTSDANVSDEQDTTQQLGKGGSFITNNNGIDADATGNAIAYEASGVSMGNISAGEEIEVMYSINVNGTIGDRYRFVVYDVTSSKLVNCFGHLPILTLT